MKAAANNAIADEILIALRRVIRAVDQHSHQLVRSHGLTGPQALLLSEILRGETMTAGELAQRVSLSRPTVTAIVQRLEAKGLLTRSQDTLDRRKWILSSTRAGRSAMKGSVPLLQRQFQSRLSELEDWEQTQLLSVLQRIAQMMDAGDLDAAPLLTSGAVTASAEALEEVIRTEEEDH